MWTTETKKTTIRSTTAILPAVLLFLAACAGPKIIDPTISAETHRLNAALFVDNQQFAKAEQETAQALLKAPADPSLHLLHGELLQVRVRTEEAARTYRRGLEAANDSSAIKRTLTHRLGLVELLELEDAAEAKRLVASLPASSLEHIDLAGAIALAEEQPVNALKILSKAPNTTTRPDMAAWIRFHAAQAYHLLGDEKNAHAALYVAVNHVENMVLKKAIEAFWNEINATH